MLRLSTFRFSFLATFIVLWISGAHPGVSPGPAKLEAAPLPDNRVVVYQFHRRFRCEACHILEAAINETLLAHFPEEIKTGRLKFNVVDLDAEGNGHFEKDYDFFYNTVIIVEIEKGKATRFKNLEEVWPLVDEKNDIMEFIRFHLAEYL
jgi:hypothetical protein